MNSIGERLREERLRQGLNLAQIADYTKIRRCFLEAIEGDEFDKLPGGFFTKSFVRQYARLLDLDDSEIEAELEERLGPAPPAPEVQVAARPPVEAFRWPIGALGDRRLLSLVGLVVVVLACSAVYAWWQRTQRLAELLNPPAQPVSQPIGAVQPAVGASAPAPASSTATQPAAAPSSSDSGDPAAQTPAQPLMAEISAARPAWVQVTADGKVVFTGTLQPNETRAFQGAHAIRLITGNAGALDVRLNGKPLGPVGLEGQVRFVDLTPEGPKITAPQPKRQPESYDPLG